MRSSGSERWHCRWGTIPAPLSHHSSTSFNIRLSISLQQPFHLSAIGFKPLQSPHVSPLLSKLKIITVGLLKPKSGSNHSSFPVDLWGLVIGLLRSTKHVTVIVVMTKLDSVKVETIDSSNSSGTMCLLNSFIVWSDRVDEIPERVGWKHIPKGV